MNGIKMSGYLLDTNSVKNENKEFNTKSKGTN